MSGVKKDKILKLAERIMEKTDNLKHIRVVETYGEVCEISEMVDKLEDYLMDYKDYKTKFKDDIRYVRSSLWGVLAVSNESQGFMLGHALKQMEDLIDKLKEVIEWKCINFKAFTSMVWKQDRLV